MTRGISVVYIVLITLTFGCDATESETETVSQATTSTPNELSSKRREFESFSFQVPVEWVVATNGPPREARLRLQCKTLPLPVGMIEVGLLPDTDLSLSQMAERFTERFNLVAPITSLALDGADAVTCQTDSRSLNAPRYLTFTSHGGKMYLLQAGALDELEDIDLGEPVDLATPVKLIHQSWKWKK